VRATVAEAVSGTRALAGGQSASPPTRRRRRA
jgi:hypothetical protein